MILQRTTQHVSCLLWRCANKGRQALVRVRPVTYAPSYCLLLLSFLFRREVAGAAVIAVTVSLAVLLSCTMCVRAAVAPVPVFTELACRCSASRRDVSQCRVFTNCVADVQRIH